MATLPSLAMDVSATKKPVAPKMPLNIHFLTPDDAINQKFDKLGGASGFLGKAVGAVEQVADKSGYFRRFTNGAIYWSLKTPACEVHGMISAKYAALGGPDGFLGYPTTDETKTPDGIGRYNHFQNGSIYWTPSTGAFSVRGDIRGKWEELGWENSVLGYPVSDETRTPDGIGRFSHFQYGSIYWSPQTGAYEIDGAVHDRWASLGWERSFLGYPVSDTGVTPDGIGRYNHFENGSIYWTPETGAFSVRGDIRGKWEELGWEQSVLGYPITDESPTPDGNGRFNHFQHGSIYWSPQTGAHEMHGAIRDKWASMGWERSFLGYPVADTADSDTLPSSTFQRGRIDTVFVGGGNSFTQVIPLSHTFHADLRFSGPQPLGGWIDITIRSDGSCTFSGYMLNTGYTNIDYSVAAALVAPTGLAVGFVKEQGHTEGATAGVLHFRSAHSEDKWQKDESNPIFATYWDVFNSGGIITCDFEAQDTFAQGVVSTVEDLAGKALEYLGKQAAVYLIGLVTA